MQSSLKKLTSYLFAALVTMTLSACPKHVNPTDLQGKWAVDLGATLDQSRKDGASAAADAQIRETFDGGLLEITQDNLIMRVKGYDGVETATYRERGAIDGKGCHALEINGAGPTHTYCVMDNQLTVQDPPTRIVVVYIRQQPAT